MQPAAPRRAKAMALDGNAMQRITAYFHAHPDARVTADELRAITQIGSRHSLRQIVYELRKSGLCIRSQCVYTLRKS